jgi:hypothetical protein
MLLFSNKKSWHTMRIIYFCLPLLGYAATWLGDCHYFSIRKMCNRGFESNPGPFSQHNPCSHRVHQRLQKEYFFTPQLSFSPHNILTTWQLPDPRCIISKRRRRRRKEERMKSYVGNAVT